MNTIFAQQIRIWQARRDKMHDAAVGRIGEDYNKQADRIKQLVAIYLDNKFFVNGLDFGCGWGRFSPWLAEHCGHLWVADIFADWVARAAAPINTTAVLLTPQTTLPAGRFNLIMDILTLQSVSDRLFDYCVKCIRQAAAPGALIISLHTTKHANKSRQPNERAQLLDLHDYEVISTTEIDDAKEPYTLLVGIKR